MPFRQPEQAVNNRIARVFPRRTRATPDDALAFIGAPGLFPPEVDAVHVSVTFSWDLPGADLLAKEWGRVAPTSIGGPATGMRGGVFAPGMYLKPGYVITSRGCPNRCWFCSAWKRDGDVRELPIAEGWNILDDNLLACSEAHVRAVFAMVERQKHRAEFTGGMDARLFREWHCDLLARLNPRQVFFAYDTPDDYEPLVSAAVHLRKYDLMRSKKARCYVLVGYPKDGMSEAERRLRSVAALGYFPMAMLYRGPGIGKRTLDWQQFQKAWCRPAATYRMLQIGEPDTRRIA